VVRYYTAWIETAAQLCTLPWFTTGDPLSHLDSNSPTRCLARCASAFLFPLRLALLQPYSPHSQPGQLQEQTRQTYFDRTDSCPTIGLCFKNNFGSKFRLTKTLLCDSRLSSNAHGGDASDFVIFVYSHLVSLRFYRSSCEGILKCADEGDLYLYEMRMRHTLSWYLYLYRSFEESPLARTTIPLASSPATMEDFAHPLR
jgi:hypothetical protein